MSHDCPVCGDLLTGSACDNCGWDSWDEDGNSRGFAFDGGRELPDTLEDHLETALEASDDPEVRYHVRSALQYHALREGRVGWRGTYGAANGGVVD